MNIYIHSYKRVGLGPLSAEASERVRILRNKNRNFFVSQNEITPEEQTTWYNRYICTANDYFFSVFHLKSGKWIGCASIYNVNADKRTAEFGRLLIDKVLVGENGLGVDATLCTCQYAFLYLGVSAISLEVFSDNISALTTYKRAGFVECGSAITYEHRKIVQMKLFKEEV